MTHQQKLALDKRADDDRIAEAMKPNTVQVGMRKGVAGITVRDRASRIAHATFEFPAQVDELIAELEAVRARMLTRCDTPPETERSMQL